MTDDQAADARMTPPEDTAAPSKPSSWPVVLGVISIILGAVGTLQGCFGGIMNLFMGALVKFLEDSESSMPGLDVQIAQLRALHQHQGFLILISISSLLIALLLLFAGIGMLKRRRWSVTASVTWAILKVLYSLPYGWSSYAVSKAQFEAMEEAATTSANAPPAFLYSLMSSATGMGLVLGLVWLWAYPVFILVWLNRSRIKAETGGWNGHRAENRSTAG